MRDSQYAGPAGLAGRAAAVGELVVLLREKRLVAVTGPGGVGKSALAAEAAHRTAKTCGRWWAVGGTDVAALDDPGMLPRQLAFALGLDGFQEQDGLPAVAKAVGDRPALLVVDTCERLVNICASAFRMLVEECPGLHAVFTSRLPVTAPATFPLRPFPLGTATEVFAESSARLAGEAPAVEPEQARHICALLDGLPLALRIAAGRLAHGPADDLLSCVSDEEAVLDLSSPGPGVPERLLTLRSSFRWSLGLCTQEEQLLWGRSSVFPGAFTLKGRAAGLLRRAASRRRRHQRVRRPRTAAADRPGAEAVRHVLPDAADHPRLRKAVAATARRGPGVQAALPELVAVLPRTPRDGRQRFSAAHPARSRTVRARERALSTGDFSMSRPLSTVAPSCSSSSSSARPPASPAPASAASPRR